MAADLDSNNSTTPFLDQIFMLETMHGTVVEFVGTGSATRLVHGVRDARPAVLVKLIELPTACLLVDVAAEADGMLGLAQVGPIIPLKMEHLGDGSHVVRFMDPSSDRYLSAHESSDAVSIDRLTAGGWECFTPTGAAINAGYEVKPVFQHVLRHILSPGRSSTLSVKTIMSLVSRGDPICTALAIALIQFAKREVLRSMVERLSELNSYASIFPVLQNRLSDHQRRFEFQVNHRLADQIARHGWIIGDHSYGTPHIIEPSLGKLIIGKYCSMNSFVIILGNHTTDVASSYPFNELARFWPTAQVSFGLTDHVSKDVTIGNDVWIGNGALLLPGTTVGDGAVIGAHAVARGTIPPYAIVVGNPGRVVRYRFDEERVAKLLKIAWWNWPDHEVDRFIPLILSKDVDGFIDKASAKLHLMNHSPSAI